MKWNVFSVWTRCAAVAGLTLNVALASGSLLAEDNFGSPLGATAKTRDASGTTASSLTPSPLSTSSGTSSSAAPAAKPAKRSTRDPVEAALALPRGKVLSKKQQEAYDKLKATQGADLRQALDDMAQAKTSADKNKALKAIKDARMAIRSGLAAVLAMPSSGDSASASNNASGTNANGSYAGSGYANGNYANGNGNAYPPTTSGNFYPTRGYYTGGGGGSSGSGSNCPPGGGTSGAGGGRSHR